MSPQMSAAQESTSPDGNEPVDLTGIGVSTLDSLQVVPEFPSGETVLPSLASTLMGGGPVATALAAASRLGLRCTMLDRVGGDWRGSRLLEAFQAHGVQTRHLLVDESAESPLAHILVRERDGQRAIVFDPGNASELQARELPADLLTRTPLLHLNGRHWPACLDAARRVRESGGCVSFDGGAHRFRPELIPLLKEVHLCLVAREFAERFAGPEQGSEMLLDTLLATGAEVVGITDGERGSVFATAGGERFHQPAFPADPLVDTTGCGDVFHGAFLAVWYRSGDLHQAARKASAAAALNATALGGRGRLCDDAELDAFLDAHSDIAHPSPTLPDPTP